MVNGWENKWEDVGKGVFIMFFTCFLNLILLNILLSKMSVQSLAEKDSPVTFLLLFWILSIPLLGRISISEN